MTDRLRERLQEISDARGDQLVARAEIAELRKRVAMLRGILERAKHLDHSHECFRRRYVGGTGTPCSCVLKEIPNVLEATELS